jgi:hypothetical protein
MYLIQRSNWGIDGPSGGSFPLVAALAAASVKYFRPSRPLPTQALRHLQQISTHRQLV